MNKPTKIAAFAFLSAIAVFAFPQYVMAQVQADPRDACWIACQTSIPDSKGKTTRMCINYGPGGVIMSDWYDYTNGPAFNSGNVCSIFAGCKNVRVSGNNGSSTIKCGPPGGGS